MASRGLRVLFATPAYWPASSFGGPIWVTRELAAGLRRRGHDVDVVTTSLVELGRRTALSDHTAELDGVRVHYLATPFAYRWMGVTPTLPLLLSRLPRPDLVHVFGFRDPIGTAVAAWTRLHRVPLALEPLGMVPERFRKRTLKRLVDPLVWRPLARAADLVVATSELERRELLAIGVDPGRVCVRPNPFPAVRPGRTGTLRRRLALDGEPLVLYVGRIARGKGIELVLEALRELPGVHLALVGPDDRHGTVELVRAAQRQSQTAGRVHLLPPTEARPLDLYADADVFVLASEGENFGLVAAEAAAAGTPVVVTDRAGIAELVDGRAGLVASFSVASLREALARLLDDEALRRRLGHGALELAAELSTDAVVLRQEELYRSLVA